MLSIRVIPAPLVQAQSNTHRNMPNVHVSMYMYNREEVVSNKDDGLHSFNHMSITQQSIYAHLYSTCVWIVCQ